MNQHHNIHHTYWLYRLLKPLWWIAIIWLILCITGPVIIWACFTAGAFAFVTGFAIRSWQIRSGR